LFSTPPSQWEVVGLEKKLRGVSIGIGFWTSEKEASQMMSSSNEVMSFIISGRWTEQVDKLSLKG
jgi:hypothetical protein